VLTARTSCTPGALGGLDFGLAVTTADFAGAFRLVHDQYVARGYIRPDPSGRRIGRHHALPSTRVFVGRADGRVVATVSLIPDSPLGLPSDEVYREELAPLRATGGLAEVSALAIDDAYRDVGLSVVRSLVQMIAVYATEIADLRTLCIAVNPRHARFYETRLRFDRFGGTRAYAAVNGAPAVGLRLDLRREIAAARRTDDPFAAGVLDPQRTAAAAGRLRADLERMKLLQSSRGARDFVRAGDVESCYLSNR
jgi:hypothetical protein